MSLLDSLFGWEKIDRIFSDVTTVQRMLDFESALAAAEADAGVIPQAAATLIAAQCRAELIDLDALARGGSDAGNLAIPLVKQLTTLVQRADADAARYVHWGTTSQDATDTGLILQIRGALDAIEPELQSLCDALSNLANEHRSTTMPARTWLQQAVPSVFGLKAAGWLDALLRHRTRMQELRPRVLVLQFGGAVGTLSSLGSKGLEVGDLLATKLSLRIPNLPWHSQRDRIAEVGTSLALLTGTLGKIARDISLMMQTEVAEVAEPAAEGRGGSSTMPQKRNPVLCAEILAAASQVPALACTLLTAMPQEHERGVGGWQSEWEVVPQLIRRAGGALRRARILIEGLVVDSTRMRENLALTQGLIFAEAITMTLALQIGKPAAYKLVEEASRNAIASKKHLREVLAQNPEFSARVTPGELDRLFDPPNYLGAANEFIDRTIASNKSETGER